MFDEALTNIIDTWERFRAHSLDKVNDGRMGDEYWESSIKLIDVEINGLRENLVKVRNKNQEVLNLRDGVSIFFLPHCMMATLTSSSYSALPHFLTAAWQFARETTFDY